ncbi:hypothetical protein CY35_09G087400 [Sphagnum magellanicum]|nr:hypothetical protein CY35_09G087400 [Sphagnum magellanicum]
MADLTRSLVYARDYFNHYGASSLLRPTGHEDPDRDEIVSSVQGVQQPSSNGNLKLCHKFLRNLTVALLSYGASAPRTEYLLEKAAECLNVKINISVFSSTTILIFPKTSDPVKDELHMLKVDSEVNLDKLQRVDELANSVGLTNTPLMMAHRQLKSIVKGPSQFGAWYWQLFSYALSSPTAAILFFSGNYWDAVLSLILGLGVGILALVPPISPVFGNMLEFISALFVSFLARVFSHHLPNLEVCFFAMAMSGLVWLLPGQNLTFGVSEVVEGSVLTGSARITKALVSSLQLGFGLAIGENLVWLLGFAVAANIFLRARVGQWFGMTLVAAIGYAVSEIAESKFGTETATVLSALAIGLSGTLCSFVSRDIPLSMIFAGLQVLLPGGIGVQGVEKFLEKDTVSGIGFVVNMVIICLSITVGLLLSKVVLYDGLFGASKVFHIKQMARKSEFFEEEPNSSVGGNEEEEDQHMAI